ncbi:MAG: lysophospholipid acyltransferase family protein [Mycobacteriales bacterium]
MLYWVLKQLAVGPVAKPLWRPWIEGAENIPAGGGAIIASNHLAVCDSLFLPLLVSRQLAFPAKKEYFTQPGVKGLAKRLFLTGVRQVPIDRGGGAAALSALAELETVLRDGGLVGFYPEGTRSPDGRLYRGKTGVARLALAARVPVIPAAMVNTDKIQPIGKVLPKLRPRPGVRLGRPLDFSRYDGMAGDRFVERALTDQLMYELMHLSGQEYVDVYAANVKREMDRMGRRGPRAARAAAEAVALQTDPDLADRSPRRRAS